MDLEGRSVGSKRNGTRVSSGADNGEDTLLRFASGGRAGGGGPLLRLLRLTKRLLLSFIMLLKMVGKVLFVIANNIYCVPTFCVWMLVLQPLRYYKPDLYWKIEGTFFHWLLAMVSMWSWMAGYDIVEMGDDIRVCLDSRTLVLVNHQSTADVPLLMACFNSKRGVLPNVMWIMDRVFKFTNFGIVSIVHQDFFILSGRDNRDRAITLLKEHLKESYIPRKRRLMVLFPEGGFLRKRRETSKRYALKNNLPVLTNVSLPRVGAMHAIMDIVGPQKKEDPPSLLPQPATVGSATALSASPTSVVSATPISPLVTSSSHHGLQYQQSQQFHSPQHATQPGSGDIGDCLSWVLDITVAYPGGKPLDLPTIVTGSRQPCQTILLYRLYSCHQVPSDHEGITEWLFSRWQEKEKILEQFYRTGEMPVDAYCSAPQPPAPVTQDNLRFLILHLFFIASSYLHYCLIHYAVSFIW